MATPAEQLEQHIAAGEELEFHAMELVAGYLELSVVELERLLKDRSDLHHERSDELQNLIEEKIKLLRDDGD